MMDSVKPPILFLNSNWKPALQALEDRYTVFNYRDCADRPALLAQAAPVVRADGRNPLVSRRIWCGGFMPASMLSGMRADKLKLPPKG